MFKGYKTLIFNVAIAVIGLLGANVDNDLKAILSDNIDSVLGAFGAINVLLRFLTTTPVFKKVFG